MITSKLNVENAEIVPGMVPSQSRSQTRLLLERWGAEPLMYFALLPDKNYFWENASDPRWAIAYRKIGRFALVLGDPLGDPNAASDAVEAFLQMCRRRRWTPAFYQVSPHHLALYRDAGLRAVKVGEEARIGLEDFTLAGKRFKNLRNDLRRVEKSGIALEEFGPDAPPSLANVQEMAAICDGWRKANRAKEANFAMGAFDPHSALFADSRIFAARDLASGRMLAFTTFVPAFGQAGERDWTLDLMRRQADALHGVMDFLIVSAAQKFAAEGSQLLSLGLSPLAGASHPGEAPQLAFIRRFLYQRMGRIYNFQGLHTFKSKFATHWEPRYLIYQPGIALAATAGAVLKAHLTPEDPPTRLRKRPAMQRGLVLASLLVLMLSPFEKTLAKRAVIHPHRWAHFHALHFHPHLLHFHPKGVTFGQQSSPVA